MRIAGVDPGQNGALILLDGKSINAMEVMPETIGEVVNVLNLWGPDHVFIEKAQVMPAGSRAMGTVSSFNYGVHFGQLLGALCCLRLPHTLVHPRTWTKVMHQGTTGPIAKGKSAQAATRLFPGQSWLASSRCKKPHDGLIDAALIAEYGRRQLVLS